MFLDKKQTSANLVAIVYCSNIVNYSDNVRDINRRNRDFEIDSTGARAQFDSGYQL